MGSRSYTEAAHDLRITVTLLKWFTKNPVKGLKLETSGGSFDSKVLEAFDAHLHEPWPSRTIPTGIDEELFREAMGSCVVCREPGDCLERAHIDRKKKEVKHYSQHPDNLILLCPTCHSRYDTVEKSLTKVVIRTAKQRAQKRLLEDIDRDVKESQAVAELLERLSKQLVTPMQGGQPQPLNPVIKRLNTIVPSVSRASGSSALFVETLHNMAELVSPTMPVTGSVLNSYGDLFSQPAADRVAPTERDLWENIDREAEPGACEQCGSATAVWS